MANLLRRGIIQPLFRLSRRVARHRHARLTRLLYVFARDFCDTVDNRDFDLATNGECHLLEQLAPLAPEFEVIYDVGANRGEWSLAAHRYLPAAHIHAFELCAPIYRKLVDNIRSVPEIQPWPLGMGDCEADVEVWYSPNNDQLSAAHPLPHVPTEKLEGKVVRGDAFAREHGHQRIDLLKIDVEGMEHLVLAGLEELLSAGRVGMIQFEYSGIAHDTHFLLKDFYRLLEGHGFVLGKLFPDGVHFKRYERRDDDLLWANYVAVRTDRQGWIEALSSPDAVIRGQARSARATG